MMARALRLAQRGLHSTSPNPRVGCVILKAGQVVGEGWHARAGEPHAEVHALQQAAQSARDATAYVTLEPCSHHGRTAPCADALIAAGVRRVVAAMQDPNPLVAGRGLARLRGAGIAVEVGLMAEAAHELNLGFVARMARGRPWLRSKIAASLDGRTALHSGVSQWITSAAARQDVQRWRARSCAILTGIGTVLADDPQLTVRDIDLGRQPLRVVVDSHLRTPPSAQLCRAGTLLVAASAAPESIAMLSEQEVEVLLLPAADGRVDLAALLNELARRACNEVLVEAGAGLNGALLRAGLVDEWLLYYAPLILGHSARGMFELPAFAAMSERVALEIMAMDRVGEDIRIRARPR